ncbi:MAG: DUF4224 domain-containing protein [Zoogloeaceae bacterium]|jgi:hypothetical protein|nr:DUF4224 domain-containing protein [Zoogloeaceae bacterium]
MERNIFLTDEELAHLTGRKLKSGQIEQLRRMMIPFHVNALGRPVVTLSAIEGGRVEPKKEPKWTPRCLAA